MGREANTTTGLADQQSQSFEENRRDSLSSRVVFLFFSLLLVLCTAAFVNSPLLAHTESSRFVVFVKPPKPPKASETSPDVLRQEAPAPEQPAEADSNPQP